MTLYRDYFRHPERFRLLRVPKPPLSMAEELEQMEMYYRSLVGDPGDPTPVLVDVTGVKMEDEDMPDLCDMAALPPFNDAWIEWHDQGTHDARQASCAVRIIKAPLPPGGRIHTVLSMATTIAFDGVYAPLGLTIFPLDARGGGIQAKTLDQETVTHWRTLLRSTFTRFGVEDTPLEELRAAGDKAYLQTVAVSAELALQHGACQNVALAAYSLLNCRNIALAPTQGPSKKKKHKRWVERGNVWHRLVVVKPGAKRSGVRVPHGTGEWLTRAHMVRGHFKTFGEEAPLFGRYTGRWWWSPATRGDERLGTVEKEYVVQGGTK